MLVGSLPVEEKWLAVSGYEGFYKVSNLGRVKSLHSMKKKVLKTYISNNGYERVVLSKYGVVRKYSVHRLVAEAFVPNVDSKQQVNHIDGNKHNNRADNLEWVTQVENQRHAVRTGLQPVIYNSPSRAKAVDMLNLDGVLVKTFPSAAEAERQTGVNNAHISSCCKGKRKSTGGFIWRYHKEVIENAR